jgi:dTDP-4-amino-4,6-dideoxygalactose transaminase
MDQTQHTLHKLVFQADDRDDVINKFKRAGIDCIVHYDPLVSDEKIFESKSQVCNSDRLKAISFTVPNQHTLTDDEVMSIGKLLS